MSAPSAPIATVDLAVGGMICVSCVARVEKKLSRLDGVEASVNREKIYFKDYLRQSSLPKTPAFRDLDESNKIYLVENFRKVTNDDG